MRDAEHVEPAGDLLPQGLASDVERVSGARIIAVRPRGGGGASREGAELRLAWPDGREEQAYMNYDVHKAGAGDDAAFLREASVLAALSGPLEGSGVCTARFIAALPDRRALIASQVAGDANFRRLQGNERMTVAADFMGQLAMLHRIDVTARPVEGMGPLRPIADTVAERIAAIRARNRAADDDPLLNLTLDWLEANVPAEPERLVIVHGDAGPGNFLFADGKVTALLDWELVHYGDPMADLAMICLRMLIQPFVPLGEVFASYRAAGGFPIDIPRIRFWRLFFQVGFAGRSSRFTDPAAPPPPNLGMNMVYSMIHRRVLAEAAAEAMGVALEPVEMPDAPEGPRWRSYQIALDDLRDAIVPHVADQRAAAKAKGLARLVKWWRDIERYEAAFHAAELRELSTALATPFHSVHDGRDALASKVSAHSIDPVVALRLCHAQTARESALMADAMGALAKSTFEPLI